MQPVIVGAARKRAAAEAAGERIIAGTAIHAHRVNGTIGVNNISTIAAVQAIGARGAFDGIIPRPTIDGVITFHTIKVVIASRTQHAVMHRAANGFFKIQNGIGSATLIRRTASGQVNRDAVEWQLIARLIAGVSDPIRGNANHISDHVVAASTIGVIRPCR